MINLSISMKIQRKGTHIEQIISVTVNSYPGGGTFIKVHPELLEVLASSEGTFDVTQIDRKYLENHNIPNDSEMAILDVGYSPKSVSYSPGAEQWSYCKGTYLTWNQFVRNGRPTEIKVREQIDISKP